MITDLPIYVYATFFVALVFVLTMFYFSSNKNIKLIIGILFLILGLARLYGGLYIKEKGAFIVSMWSWVVEFIYTISELFHGQFIASENIAGLVMTHLMLVWSLIYFNRTFTQKT
jgi:hypothetical protein